MIGIQKGNFGGRRTSGIDERGEQVGDKERMNMTKVYNMYV
jgi:hypothetical protein